MTIFGSWVTNLWRMVELVERLFQWIIHPDKLITHRFMLVKADEVYTIMSGDKCGRAAVVFDEEID